MDRAVAGQSTALPLWLNHEEIPYLGLCAEARARAQAQYYEGLARDRDNYERRAAQKAGEIRRLSFQLASHAVRLAELELPERDDNWESQRGFAETQRQLDSTYGAIQVSFNRLSQATRMLKSLKTRALDLQEALPAPYRTIPAETNMDVRT